MKKRIITAVVGISLAVLLLFLADTPIFPLTVAALTVIALYELLKVCRCTEYKVHTIGCYIYGAAMPFMCAYLPDMIWRILFSAVIMELMFMGYVGDHKKLPFSKLCIMITCTIMVSISFSGLITLHQLSPVHGISYIIITLASAWLADGGAYFAGTFWGKHKLCPDISPKKTVEGAVGGIVANVLVLCIYGFGYQKFMASRGIVFDVNYVAFVIIGIVTSILGIFGDLTASLLKREHEVKDYGNIIPGHGGVMDRFDSVLFVLPFMVMFLSFVDIFV